jgi:hypothetical protein
MKDFFALAMGLQAFWMQTGTGRNQAGSPAIIGDPAQGLLLENASHVGLGSLDLFSLRATLCQNNR